MAAYFVIGDIYNVWETKGLANNKNGHPSVSEKISSPNDVINPSQDAKYLGKDHPGFEGYHAFSLDDGTVFTAHRNHFDITTEYCQSKIRNRKQRELKQQEKDRAAALKAEEDAKNAFVTSTEAVETADEIKAIQEMLQESGAAEELVEAQDQSLSDEADEETSDAGLLEDVLREVEAETEASEDLEELEASNG